MIRDLATGRETRLPADPADADVRGVPAGWLPDGRLIVNLVYPGDSPGSIRLVDPVRPPASLLEAPEVEPGVPDVTGWWAVGSDRPIGGVLVRETCCGLVGTDNRIVSVDPDSGEELGTVVPGAWFVVEPDASGRHLLLVDDQGIVYVARDGEAPQPVADGFLEVAW